ncbi:hypothetical protein Fmac_002502 [Flemingia macrophylla]|uniref:Uncharacterized protein n=1 Tax=Flemingia macrophylla TaxID=520843 RepID=A0ABD1NK52_9FABA
MKDEEGLPTVVVAKKEGLDSGLLGKGRYKFWALAAILLLAFWSMFTGTVSLRWSGTLNSLTTDIDAPIHDDLDVLVSFSSFPFLSFPFLFSSSQCHMPSVLFPQEMEEREKVVRHMWDVYTNSRRIRLPRFWQEAFEAAYEDLTSDVPDLRDAAITEIAKMSVRSLRFDPPPLQSTVPSLLPLLISSLLYRFTPSLSKQFSSYFNWAKSVSLCAIGSLQIFCLQEK